MKTTSDLVQITALWTIAFMFFVLFVLALFAASSGRIEIRQSYSTGECVSMIVYDNEYPYGKVHPCPAELPKRYTHIWVQ